VEKPITTPDNKPTIKDMYMLYQGIDEPDKTYDLPYKIAKDNKAISIELVITPAFIDLLGSLLFTVITIPMPIIDENIPIVAISKGSKAAVEDIEAKIIPKAIADIIEST